MSFQTCETLDYKLRYFWLNLSFLTLHIQQCNYMSKDININRDIYSKTVVIQMVINQLKKKNLVTTRLL